MTIDPYTTPGHALHVRMGYCSAISWAKAWCNDWAGHKGSHWSRRDIGGGGSGPLAPLGRFVVETWTELWTP